ncbi:MAG: alpha-galactosidase, partial [Lachnospiraceae bacterium]|nr:alpha-galactosidase [Lachnospiraceae bacterium]
ASGEEPGTGRWLQLAVGEELFYDDFLAATDNKETFVDSQAITVTLAAGANRLRVMNHRRQENTLHSYAALLSGLNKENPKHDVVLSLCEWGKTQPQNWGYKVADSWRILNDITFCVGGDGNPGRGTWFDGGTASVTSQYDKAVVMDEFAGLDKGWNDPDMMMIGMDGLNETMCKTHMAMWCMMNSPLMLGLDLRRVTKGDWMYNIIANKKLIALNQDALGIQAKRIYTTIETDTPDTDYITNHNRCDVLAKPLADGDVALCFINVNDQPWEGELTISAELIVKLLGHKMVNAEQFAKAKTFEVTDLWSGETTQNTTGNFTVAKLAGCENVTLRVKAL